MGRSLERTFKRLLSRLLPHLLRTTRPPADFSTRTYERILVIRQHNQLGDMLCVVPLLRALRARYPGAYLALMSSPVNHDVMLHNRYLDQVLKYDKQQLRGILGYNPVKLLGFVRRLRAIRPDLVLVPSTVSTSFTSDLLGYLSGARVRIGIGSMNGRENPSAFFFNVRAEVDWQMSPHRHQTLRNLDVGARLALRADDLSGEVSLTEQEIHEGKLRVEKGKAGKTSVVALHPGAGKIPNRWPAGRFAAVAAALAREMDIRIFVIAGPMDQEPVEVMVEAVGEHCEVVSSLPIREVAAMLKQMDLLLSNDTGIMHVGAAVGTSVLSLFGPTDPLQWAPKGERHRFIVGSDGRIESIGIREVLETAKDMLRASSSGERAG